jgi:hypothetical protein
MGALAFFLFVAQQLAISVSIGAATFALIFYYKSIRDGSIDREERSFLNVVYLVLRIGLSAIVLSELLLVADFFSVGASALILTGSFWFRWLLIGIIVINAVLMDVRKVPHWLGPALTASAWYMYAIATILARANFELPFVIWILWYVMFLCVFVLLLMVVDKTYIRKAPAEWKE